MSKARPIHQAQRSIADLTIKGVKATQKLQRWYEEQGLSETDQQYQFQISGTAATLAAFTTLPITFDFPFHYAPGQRDSDLETPHMTYGFVCDAFVMLSAHVVDWTQDEDTGAYTAATVAVGCLSAVSDLDFTGVVHMTFQGFSAPDDTDTSDLET